MINCKLGNIDLDTQPFVASSHYRLNSIDFGAPPTEIHEVSSARADIDLQADYRTSALRDIVANVTVKGSSASDLFTKLRALAAEVGKPTNTLTVLPEGLSGSTSVTFKIRRNPEPEFAVNHAVESTTTTVVTFVLKALPYAYGAAVTPITLTFATGCPAIASVAAVYGDRPVPATLEFVKSNLHALYAALVPSGAQIQTYMKQAEDLSWTGGSKVTSASVAGITGTANNTNSNPSTNYAQKYGGTTEITTAWTLPVQSSLPNGRYRLLVRGAVDNAAGQGTVRFTDGHTGETIASKTFSDTAWTLYDLGEVTIPLQPAMDDTAARSLTIGLKTKDTNPAYLDYFLLLPTDAVIFYHDSTAGGSLGQLDVAGDGTVYQDKYIDFTDVTGSPLVLPAAMGGAPSAILVVADDIACDAAPTLTTATLTYEPRYVMWGVAS